MVREGDFLDHEIHEKHERGGERGKVMLPIINFCSSLSLTTLVMKTGIGNIFSHSSSVS